MSKLKRLYWNSYFQANMQESNTTEINQLKLIHNNWDLVLIIGTTVKTFNLWPCWEVCRYLYIWQYAWLSLLCSFWRMLMDFTDYLSGRNGPLISSPKKLLAQVVFNFSIAFSIFFLKGAHGFHSKLSMKKNNFHLLPPLKYPTPKQLVFTLSVSSCQG